MFPVCCCDWLIVTDSTPFIMQEGMVEEGGREGRREVGRKEMYAGGNG